jgi:ABC-type tungstate transport system substrate-binding protein
MNEIKMIEEKAGMTLEEIILTWPVFIKLTEKEIETLQSRLRKPFHTLAVNLEKIVIYEKELRKTFNILAAKMMGANIE